MTDTVSSCGDEGRPDPAKASTPTEFVDAMLRLKRWTGWGFRRLEKRAAAAGHLLPRSTLTAALTRQTLPREDLVAALTQACGCDEAETARWIAARRRIAAAAVPLDPEPPRSRVPNTRWRALRLGRRARRIVALAVALVAVAAAIAGYVLLGPDNPSALLRGPNQAAPVRPDPSRPQPTQPAPESTTDPTSSATPAPPTAAVTPAAETVPQPAPTTTARSPSAPSSTPTSVVTPPPAQESGREAIYIPGEPLIYCPRPYLNTAYAALAQCTQVSGDQARTGYYSPYANQFNPTSGWMTVQDQEWHDALVLATDGVRASARGYAIVNTKDGGAVFATQYRDGEARWGIINLVDGQFRPAAGWHLVGY